MRLLAFDLDGTLVDRQSRLSEENRRAVERARAAGLETLLVTGRSWRGARQYYDELGMTGPAILYLGALVVADGSGRVLHYRPLVREAWSELRQFAVSERLAVTACMGTDQAVADGELPAREMLAADVAYATCAAEDFTDWQGWNPYTEFAHDLGPCKAPPAMVAVYGDRAVDAVLARFPHGLQESQFDVTDRIAGEKVLHVWHRGVDKGCALADFCRARGIEPGEVAAFGDASMDLSMIRYAGIGVAMPHGHPVLKAAATWVADPAEAIDRILEGVG